MPAMMLAKLTMVSLIFLIKDFEFSRFARSQNRKKSTTSWSPTPLQHLHVQQNDYAEAGKSTI